MIAEGERRHGAQPRVAASRICPSWRRTRPTLPFGDGEFDTVTMSFGLRNVNEPKKALRELLRVTKPGGRLVICEFSHPPSRAFNGLYRFYNDRVLPVVAKAVSSNAEAYDYLNESIRDWPDQRTLVVAGSARRAGRMSRTATSRSGIVALHRATKPAEPAPVGWRLGDSLSAGLAARGQAGPHRPHFRGTRVPQLLLSRRGRA